MRCRTAALVPLSQELCSYLLSTFVAEYGPHALRPHSATSLLLRVRMLNMWTFLAKVCSVTHTCICVGRASYPIITF